DIGKPLSDVFSMSESKVFDIGKNVAESLTFSETFAKAVGMNVTESFSMSESPAFDFYKVLDDTQTIIETFVAGTRLFVSELFSISDSVAFAQTYGRVFGETMAIVDSVVMLSGKNVADNMAISDAFASVASMYRSFTDAEPLSDALVVSISKVLSDIFSSSDDIFKSLQIGEQLASQKDIAALLADPRSEVRPWMPWVAIGASDIEGNELYDTALWDELHRKLGDVSVTANTYFVRAAFGQDEPTADDLTIYEIGIFDAATGGVMGKRWVLNTGVDKDNVDEIVVECAVTILHGNIEEARVLFNLAPGADAIVEDNITQQPVDVQSMSDSISFVLNKNVSFSDNMAISDSIVTAHDMNSSFSDNMAMVDGSPPPPVITVLDSLLAGGGCVNGLDLDEVKGVLYVANASGFLGSGLYVYDVSDPTNLANVGYAGYPLGVTSSANDVVIIDSNYVAQVSFNNVDIFDVSDPINPFHVVTVSVVGAPRRLQYRDNYVYTANGNAAHGISVVDVTNRAASVEIWNSVVDAGLDIGGVNDVWVEGNYLYAGDGSVEGVSVFDIADPTNPVLVGQVDVAVRRMMALGNYLYVARSETFPSSGRGLKIIDISDPTNPTLVNTVETVDIAFSLFVHSKGTRTYVHVGNWSADLWSTIKPVIEIFDVSDPLNVKQLATEEFGFVLPGDGRYKGFEDMIVNSDGTVLFGGESRTQLHAVDVSDTSGTLISMAWVCAQYLS
ncbi:hypothetical protein KAR91_45375, partial [Candidatus Pacearchaeota archaeon]|nr:hypothetical protein [Candidatus Pacearchaeota archaeon]